MNRFITVKTTKNHWMHNKFAEFEVMDEKIISFYLGCCKRDEPINSFPHRNFDSYRIFDEEPGFENTDDFIEKFARVFAFFGSLESLEIEGGTFDEVYRFVRNIPVPPGLNFIKFQTCGCNMGNCDAIESFKFRSYRTIGEIMADIGSYKKTDKMTGLYYEHPDSVVLRMEKLKDYTLKMTNGTCYKKPMIVKLDETEEYISLMYTR